MQVIINVPDDVVPALLNDASIKNIMFATDSFAASPIELAGMAVAIQIAKQSGLNAKLEPAS